MKDYYKILAVDELTSKPLVKISYVTAIEYCLSHDSDADKISDVNEAFQIIKKLQIKISI